MIPKYMIAIVVALLVAFSSFVFAWGSINNRVDTLEVGNINQDDTILGYNERVNSCETNYAVIEQKIDGIASDIQEIKADVKDLGR